MKIALVSYEFSGIATGGGIGTYTRNVAHMLAGRGHIVEVFTSGESARSIDVGYGLRVNTICSSREEFSTRVLPVFVSRHESVSFDVVEGPDYNADASQVAVAFPELPRVVKLHGPSFTIFESNAYYVSSLAKARYFGGALVRGRIPNNPWKYDPAIDPERAHVVAADEITANSMAMAHRAADAWSMPLDRIVTIPLVFSPSPELLKLDPQSNTKAVLFLGRLEVRKGVIELSKAIPLVLREDPSVRFRFVGRSLPHPEDGCLLTDHISKSVGKHIASVELLEGVPYGEIPKILSDCDICVFPSHWEASGFVCLEAMAAARGVIGSGAGGMAELIRSGCNGLLIPNCNPTAIAEAIISLLRDAPRRISMGRAAREHVLSTYSPEKIGPAQEASYRRAIERAQRRQTSQRKKQQL